MREWAGKGLLCLSRRRVRQPLPIPKEPPNEAPSEHQFRVTSECPTLIIVQLSKIPVIFLLNETEFIHFEPIQAPSSNKTAIFLLNDTVSQ